MFELDRHDFDPIPQSACQEGSRRTPDSCILNSLICAFHLTRQEILRHCTE